MDESAGVTDIGGANSAPPGTAQARIASLRTAPRASRLDVAVVGPPESGKSSLLAALQRFSGSPDGARSSGLRVTVVSEPALEGSREMPGDAFSVSRLQIDFAGPAADSCPREITLTELDLTSSGGSTDPQGEWRAPWPMRHAPALVLCVDAQAPDGGFWRRAWPRLARSLQTSTGRSVLSLDGEEQAPELRLGNDRVLVLLTRADRPLQVWREAGAGITTEGDSLRSLACRIDARRWLAELLGFDLASAVRAQLRPQARLAVGITACTGRGEEPVEEFGVAETLEFLLTGEAKEPLDTVAAVDEAEEPWLELEPASETPVEQNPQAAAAMVSSLPRPRLFLKPPRTDRAGCAPALARWLRLDSYSNRLLTKAARLEMGMLAALLAGVAVFELTVWTLLFNAILHAEVTAISKRSLAAVGLGILFAGAIVYLDRSFLVADPTQKGHRRAAAFRIGIVFLSALATSLTIDLIFFAGPIEARRHEEQLRAELVARAEGLREDWEPPDVDQVGSEEGNPFLAMETEVAAKLATLRGERNSLSGEQAAAAAAARRWRQRVRELDVSIDRAARVTRSEDLGGGEGPPLDDLRRDREAALDQAVKREAEAQALADRVAALDVRIAEEVDRRGALQERADSLVDEELKRARERRSRQEASSDRIVAWITFLRGSDPPDDVLIEPAPPPNEEPWEYRLTHLDLFERFRILFDLLAGRPPQWPSGAPEKLVELRQRFHLEDPVPCQAPVPSEPVAVVRGGPPGGIAEPCDDIAWQRMQKRADFFTFSYFLLFFVAAVVPLTVLIIKLFLMPQALSCYYSLVHQAAAGDVDAVLVSQTLKKEGPPS